MHVLLVNPTWKETFSLIFPLNLSYIGTSLCAKGHTVKVLDLDVSAYPLNDLKKAIEGESPDVIGVSLSNVDLGLDFFFKTVKIVRQFTPNTRIIASEAGFSISAERFNINVV